MRDAGPISSANLCRGALCQRSIISPSANQPAPTSIHHSAAQSRRRRQPRPPPVRSTSGSVSSDMRRMPKTVLKKSETRYWTSCRNAQCPHISVIYSTCLSLRRCNQNQAPGYADEAHQDRHRRGAGWNRVYTHRRIHGRKQRSGGPRLLGRCKARDGDREGSALFVRLTMARRGYRGHEVSCTRR